MTSKPTTWTRSVDVAAPNFGISGGRARGWDGGEYPSAENKKEASMTRAARTKMERQERHGRLGDNDFSCSFCNHHEHRSGDCRERLGKLLAQGVPVRGLLRIVGEDFVKARTIEVIEAATNKKATKWRSTQGVPQQKRAADKTA